MSTPRRTLSIVEGVAVIVGIVVGMGIFRAPAQVAGAAGSLEAAMAFWALGGVVSLLGALTYCELAAAYPGRDGEMGFLRRAYGSRLAFVFGWSRLAVIQTGTIAGAGFVAGDYLQALAPLGAFGPALYASGVVLLVGAANLAGLRPSAGAQTVLAIGLVACLLALAAAGLTAPAPPPASASVAAAPPPLAAAGFAMIFVLLTFGGWNEGAYLSGEVRRPQRDMALILIGGVGLVTLLYLAVNFAYLRVLGVEATAGSDVVGADLAARVFGPAGALLVTVFVLAATLSTCNGTMFTGARSAAALGEIAPALGWLSRWNEARGAPVAAVLTQTGVALALVLLGALAKQGFETMVAYTAPVFWTFFLLTGLAAIVLRVRDPARPRPFRTPLYPLTPLLFCAAAGWMLWSSLTYAASLAASEGPAADGFALGVSAGLLALLSGAVLAAFLPRAASRS